jgi:hypothetical protein
MCFLSFFSLYQIICLFGWYYFCLIFIFLNEPATKICIIRFNYEIDNWEPKDHLTAFQLWGLRAPKVNTASLTQCCITQTLSHSYFLYNTGNIHVTHTLPILSHPFSPRQALDLRHLSLLWTLDPRLSTPLPQYRYSHVVVGWSCRYIFPSRS